MFCIDRFKNWGNQASRPWTDADVCKYYDREVRLADENKSIGMVLCKNKSESVIEYTLPENNEQIFASKYQTVLPSKEALNS